MPLLDYSGELTEGAVLTSGLALASLFLGIVLGLIGAAAKLSRAPWIRGPAFVGTTVLRGIPEFLILLTVYFGLPELLRTLGYPIDIGPFTTGVLALSLVFGAYASEVFRGAFEAVPRGQLEAGRALGMGPARILLRIRLPQAWRVALPSLSNQWQALLKDTALVSVVGLEELMRKAVIGAQVTKRPFTFYFAAALVYLALLGLSNPVFALLERRASRYLRP